MCHEAPGRQSPGLSQSDVKWRSKQWEEEEVGVRQFSCCWGGRSVISREWPPACHQTQVPAVLWEKLGVLILLVSGPGCIMRRAQCSPSWVTPRHRPQLSSSHSAWAGVRRWPGAMLSSKEGQWRSHRCSEGGQEVTNQSSAIISASCILLTLVLLESDLSVNSAIPVNHSMCDWCDMTPHFTTVVMWNPLRPELFSVDRIDWWSD